MRDIPTMKREFDRTSVLAKYLTFREIKTMMGPVLLIYKWTSQSS